MDAKHFRGEQCRKCSGILRYVVGGACVACQKVRNTSPRALAYMAAYRATPKVKATQRALRTEPGVLAKQMVLAAKQRARGRFAFNLHPTPIEMRIRLGFCEATKLPFDLTLPDCDGGTNVRPFGPSIDRIDNARGYTFDNIRVVCNIYNLSKNGFSEAHLLTLARALVRIHGDDCNIS